MSLNVLPDSSGKNGTNKWSGHAEFSGKSHFCSKPRKVGGAYHSHNPVGQLRVGVFLALNVQARTRSISSPALFDAILNIVILCAKKQMIWIHARFIVAFVTHIHSFWNGAIAHLKCQPVGKECPPNSLHFPISVGLCASNPIPTVCKASSLHPIPESFFKGALELFDILSARFSAYFSSCHSATLTDTPRTVQPIF